MAGTAGGRTITVPPAGTRPTTERVREAVFSRLEHWDVVNRAVVLDLYAGSGALGLEAASRGAKRVIFVESHPKSARLISSNARKLGLDGVVDVQSATVEKWLDAIAPTLAASPLGAHLVFLDPPYDVPAEALDKILQLLAIPGMLDPDAGIVVERDVRTPAPTWPAEWQDEGTKTYGDTRVHYARPALVDDDCDGADEAADTDGADTADVETHAAEDEINTEREPEERS